MRLKSDKDEGFNKKLRAERLLKQNYISSYAAIIQVSFRLATHILKIKNPIIEDWAINLKFLLVAGAGFEPTTFGL